VKLSAYWRSIAARIFGSLVGVSFVCIAVSVLSLYLQSGRALRSNIEQRNLEIAQQASREIARYVTDAIDELGSLGSILGPLPYSTWVQKTVLSNLSLEFKKFRWIALLGPDGNILVDSDLAGRGNRLLDTETLKLVLSGRSIDSPVKIAEDYTPYMIVSTPARTASGARGWLAAELHLRSIWELVDQISVGGKKVAYLVTKAGTLIAHPDKTRVVAPENAAPVLPPPRDLSESGAVRVEKEQGVERYLTAYAEVGLLDWVIAVQQPVQDAFLPASVLWRQSLLLLLIGIGLSLVLGLLISRALSLPFVHLLEGTRTISSGNLDFRIDIKGGEEVRRLADSFNAMVKSLQARTAQLVESERQYRLMTERVNDIIFTLEEHGRFTFVSPRLQSVIGVAIPDLLGKQMTDVVPLEDKERMAGLLWELLNGNGRIDREMQIDAAVGGRKILFELHLTADGGPAGKRQVYGVARDVSERAKLLDQLNQAQKMEAVGRLAGGVAHDFNNLLTAIIGYCDYSRLNLDDKDTLQKSLDEIKKAGVRAAGLTQQLLAFSRRQVMKPKVIDLNQLVVNLQKMLLRLLGEDIALETVAAPDLGAVLVDPGQVEQVIMNLCINSRDAMPRGGRITVETSNVLLESSRRDSRMEVMRGDYVRLRIIDNGIGMDRETRSHLFEPFFTTKEVGKGTGLGLSTVYGIVKQTGGYIWVESEPGAGATFDIFFPRAHSPAETQIPAELPGEVRGGNESILLVEDESMIRVLVRSVLASNGYTVLEADNGEQAKEIFQARGAGIDIIIADIVLPGISGRDLVEHMKASRPDMPALFMSGYTPDVIDNHGQLQPGLAFLQKPFTPESLLLKVREVLDTHRRD
jgi:PAS domain S-box-containing protein